MGLNNIVSLVQITVYILAFITSFAIFVPLSFNIHEFNWHCLLFATGRWLENATYDLHVGRSAGGSFEDVSGVGQLSAEWSNASFCMFPLMTGILTLPLAFFYIVSLAVHIRKLTDQ